jgi:hypothetical protein
MPQSSRRRTPTLGGVSYQEFLGHHADELSTEKLTALSETKDEGSDAVVEKSQLTNSPPDKDIQVVEDLIISCQQLKALVPNI